jgi:hypothetical protein
MVVKFGSTRLLELGHRISRDRFRACGNRRIQGYCAVQN